jgi:hypothetical protein
MSAAEIVVLMCADFDVHIHLLLFQSGCSVSTSNIDEFNNLHGANASLRK